MTQEAALPHQPDKIQASETLGAERIVENSEHAAARTAVTPIEAVLQFSATREAWQQDALRRLHTQGSVNDRDIEEFVVMVKRAGGLSEPRNLIPVPLGPEHIRQAAIGSSRTVLNAIGDVAHINRLAPHQTLQFAVSGITLIYGENAAGKSGYCRLLKKVCRVRRAAMEDVLANAFDQEDQQAPEATFRFTLEGQPPQDIRWRSGTLAPDVLSRISIFDSRAVPVYADQQNRIEFLPHGLDLLPLLGETCQRVARLIEQETAEIQRRVSGTALPAVPAGTSVARLSERLVPGLGIENLPSEEEIQAAGTWHENDDRALADVQSWLAGDARASATRYRRVQSAIARIADAIAALYNAVDAGRTAAMQVLFARARDARTAADIAAMESMSDSPLPGVGSEPWRLLFERARAYSMVAYPDQEFPVTGEGARCVLCQQLLDDEASKRLQRFDDFVRNTILTEAQRLERERDLARSSVQGLGVPQVADWTASLDELLEIDPGSAGACALARKALEAVLQRRQALVDALAGTRTFEDVPPLPESPEPALREATRRLLSRAEEYDRADDPTERGAREAERDELLGRQTIAQNLAIFIARRQDLRHLAALRSCRAKCDTTEISRTMTELRRRFITDDFANRLADEIRRLRLDHLPIRVTDHSERGDNYLGVGLDAVVPVANRQVLSEGELRALALACFLAEVGSIPGHDGLVVDDPVSSLDHRRVRQVAKRLVDEARDGRQVVIFTHDLVFYHELMTGAAAQGVAVETYWMRDTATGAGVLASGEGPWEVTPVKRRLATLDQKIVNIKRLDQSSPDYGSAITDFYTDLRESWERLVEEVLLNQVIGRFQPEMQTLRLKGVLIEDDDYKKVYFGMKRASEFSGHDRAIARQASLPTPDEMQQDVLALRVFVDELNRRRGPLEQSRKKLEEPPAATVA